MATSPSIVGRELMGELVGGAPSQIVAGLGVGAFVGELLGELRLSGFGGVADRTVRLPVPSCERWFGFRDLAGRGCPLSV